MTKQQHKVYKYILENPGCTTKEITLNTGIQCPSGRISEIRDVAGIVSVGQKKYPGSKPYEMYKIGTPLTKRVPTYHIDEERGVMVETFREVIV